MKLSKIFFISKSRMTTYYPQCNKCLFYKPYSYPDYSALGKCMKFGNKDLISGNIDYDYADMCRRDSNKCNSTGIYFIHKPLEKQ